MRKYVYGGHLEKRAKYEMALHPNSVVIMTFKHVPNIMFVS